MNGKEIIVRNDRHLRLIAGLSCLVTGARGQSQAHHLLRGTGQKGMGQKSGDNFAIPLHYKIHEALHRDGNESLFLAEFGIIDQVEIAQQLYLCLHPHDLEEFLALKMVKVWRENARKPRIKRILAV